MNEDSALVQNDELLAAATWWLPRVISLRKCVFRVSHCAQQRAKKTMNRMARSASGEDEVSSWLMGA